MIQSQPTLDLAEIIEELDELGRAKFDAALERVKVRKLQARVEELEARERDAEAQRANHVPPPVRNAKELAEHTGQAERK